MKGEDIPPLFSHAQTRGNPLFTMKFSRNTENKAVFAVATGKKTFKTAVERNRVRRRVYSAIRAAQLGEIPYSIIFIPNRESLKAPFQEVVLQIKNICRGLRK